MGRVVVFPPDEAARLQRKVEVYAAKHNPCCAGCDWWRYYNAVVGECIRSAIVAGSERVEMLGVEAVSLRIGAGHVMTPRGHYCGEFRDTPEGINQEVRNGSR